VKRSSFAGMQCSIAQTLEIVGDPWTLLIVRDAFFGLRRFDQFQQSLGIPRATLAARLATLVDHGIFEMQEYDSRPPRSEYVLTAKGSALRPILISMLQWGDRWSGLPEPPVTLVDRDSGAPVSPRYVDERSGRPLDELHVVARRNV
jgi:DNA-binding HxlR family transcriptional regulator